LKKRICIASPDLIGPIRNGGIGSACFEIAKLWKHFGHDVTCLFVNQQLLAESSDDQWRSIYSSLGITFVDCPNDLRNGFYGHYDNLQFAWSAWIWLRQQNFDVIYFPEWRAVGLYAIQAKAAGLDFDQTHMIVGTHSPTYWHIEGCGRTPANLHDLVLDAAERQCIRWCDTVISPSNYLIEYMNENKWPLPSDVNVIPNPIWKTLKYSRFEQVSELVFFGRLEYRKGLRQFIDAVHLLSPELKSRLKITFLGKEGDFPGGANAYIQSKNSGEFDSWTILNNYNSTQAIDYLMGSGRLAVMPSLVENSPMTVRECIANGILFITSNVGGICELIDKQDIDRSTFDPTPQGIASALRKVISRGAWSIRSAFDEKIIDDIWNQVLNRQEDKKTEYLEETKVSVVLVTHNRSDALQEALEGLRRQTTDNFEVILVDDGSTKPDVMKYLDSLSEEFETRGWTIIRQNNAYLGAARNAGWRAASGDIIIFHDDDNYSAPELIETYRKAILHSNADIVTCAMVKFKGPRPDLHPFESLDVYPTIGDAGSAGMYLNGFGDAHAAFKREVLEYIGGFTEDIGVGHEDWEIFAKAALSNCTILHIPKPLFWYRISDDSMLRARFSPTLDYLRSLRPYLEKVPAVLRPALTFAMGLSQNYTNPDWWQSATKQTQNATDCLDFNGLDTLLPSSLREFYLQPDDESSLCSFMRLCIDNSQRHQYDVILTGIASILPSHPNNLSLWEIFIFADIRGNSGRNAARIFSSMPALAIASDYLSVAWFDLCILREDFHDAFIHFANVYHIRGISDPVTYMIAVLDGVGNNPFILKALDDLISIDESKTPSERIIESFLGVELIC
jgi:glycosyltransferase involved in cell wall biosynthesis